MSRSRSRSPAQRRNQIYIGYLPNHATMDDVEDFFKGYGAIKSINLKPGYGMQKNQLIQILVRILTLKYGPYDMDFLGSDFF